MNKCLVGVVVVAFCAVAGVLNASELTGGYLAHIKGGTLVVRNAATGAFGIQNAKPSDGSKCAIEDSVIVIESGICTLY